MRLAAAVGGWIALSAAVGFGTSALLPNLLPGWAGYISRLSAVIVAEVYALLIVSIVAAMGGVAKTAARLRIGPLRGRDVGIAAAIWAAAYGVTLAAHAVVSALWPAFPTPSDLLAFLTFIGTDMGRLVNAADPATWGLVLVRACLLAPVGEELLFRGALFGWLRRRLSAWPTILITGLAFAGIHGLALTMLPLAIVVGVAAGYARERLGSVTPLIAVHIGQNVIVEIAGAASLG